MSYLVDGYFYLMHVDKIPNHISPPAGMIYMEETFRSDIKKGSLHALVDNPHFGWMNF